MAVIGHVWVIADKPVVGGGGYQAAWQLEIETGSDALSTAAAFAISQNFPIGTQVTVVDLLSSPIVRTTWRLDGSWTQL